MSFYAYSAFTADGVTTDYAVSFPYIQISHVVVKLDGLETSDFTWVNPSLIRFNSAPASGSIEIYRDSSRSTRLVNIGAGQTSRDNLDRDSTQAFYLAQEAFDGAALQAAKFTIDATGTTAGRSAYDSEESGFTYLDTDTDLLYVRVGSVSGTWSSGVSLATGPQGPSGPQGPQGEPGPAGNTSQPLLKKFTGDGSTSTFDLTSDPGSDANVQAFIDGVVQHSTEWFISTTNITFSDAPYDGAQIEVYVFGIAAETTVPADGSVTGPKLANSAVTTVKIPDGAVTPDKRTHQFFIAREQYDVVTNLAVVAGDNVRVLNTVDVDDFGTVSLSGGGQISGLPSGRYRVTGYASKYASNIVHQVYLFNVTDGHIVLPGHAGYSGTSSGTDSVSIPISGILNIGQGRVFEFRQWVSGAYSNGAGYVVAKRADLDLVFAEITFERIGA